MDDIISVCNLHKYFNPETHVLRGIDFSVRCGQMVSIIGRSGCGKTTLLRCLNYLEAFDKGTVRIAGVTLSMHESAGKSPAADPKKTQKKHDKPFSEVDDEIKDREILSKAHILRQRVGMVFQSFNLFPHLSVIDNVALAPVVVARENRGQAREYAASLLEKVGLGALTARYPHELSGGQSQRVAIARALAMKPEVMLYDEPTSALDPELVEEVVEVMRNLHAEGMTQLVVTHKMSFARNASDAVIYMDEGQIVEMGPPDAIFDHPADSRTKQYISIFKD